MDALNDAIKALERARDAKTEELQVIERALQELRGVGSPSTRGSLGYQSLGITEAARKLLSEEGGDLTTREIAEALLSRGIRTKSKNFVATVYATLEQNRSFCRTADGTWTFRGDVNYVVPKGTS